MKRGFSNKKCGILGEHLAHSFSPLIHSFLGDYSYDICEVDPKDLESFLKNNDLDAFNVTIPYKKAVIPYLDFVSIEAMSIGAVNLVIKKDGKLWGYNTDYFGFEYPVYPIVEPDQLLLRTSFAFVFSANFFHHVSSGVIFVIGRSGSLPSLQ